MLADTTDQSLLDHRITLWGLLLEVHAGIGRRLARELRAAVDLPDPWLEVLLRIGRTPGQAVRMTDLANQVLLAVHLPGLQRYLCDPLDAEQRRQLEGILRTLRAALGEDGAGSRADAAP
jgi:hypothetical protein